MHILFLLDYYKPHLGGAETVFEHIIQRLLGHGHTISVITTKHDPKLPDVETDKLCTIYRVGSTRKNFMRYGWLQGKKICKQTPVDVIHTTTYSAAVPARMLGRAFGIRTLITVHEVFGKLRYTYKWRKGLFFFLFEKILINLRFDVYHCVSWYTYNCLRITYGIPDAKLHMIYNGVDEEFWNPHTVDQDTVTQLRHMYGFDDKFVVMYFGHSGTSKWLDYLIDAIPSLVERMPNIVVVLNIIHAQRDAEIQAKLQRIGCEKHIVQFHGLLKKDLLHKVATVDCVIVPSLSDGFGLVAAEVSALEKPLIVSGVAALPEVVSGTIRRLQPASSHDILEAVHDMQQKKNIVQLPKKHFLWNESVKKIEKLYMR